MNTTASSDLHRDDCLSFGDSLFLHLEREGMPLHVATLSAFEGQISLKDCIRYVEAKLPLIPRYRQRVVPPPLGVGLPSWQFDRSFDVRNHVREVTLSRGTESELRRSASRILGTTMDRTRPLWDLTLFRGLKGDRTGVLARVHHSMADGVSGVALMTVLMDTSPEPPAILSEEPRRRRTRGHRPPSVIETFLECCLDAVQRLLTAQSEVLNIAQNLAAAAKGANGVAEDSKSPATNPDLAVHLEDLNSLLPELLAPAERLPFNIVCRGPQRFACAEIPLADLKAVKHACGATVNDVVLALVTSTVRRYVRSHGVSVRGRDLRIVVPVNLRHKSEMKELGNNITFLPITVPLDCHRLRGFVNAAHRTMAILRGAQVGELVRLTGTLLGAIPGPFQETIGRIASQLPLSVCNLICTNVPGPRSPLYLLGHKMLSCYPYVPIGGEMGMNCAVLTYNGVAYFGFTGDVHAIPDIELLPRFLMASFAALKKETASLARARAVHAAASEAPTVQPESSPPAAPPAPKRPASVQIKQMKAVAGA